MQRYFVEQSLNPQEKFQLSKEDTHHLVRVMRTPVGKQVEVVDTNKKVFVAELMNSESEATLMVLEDVTKQVELPIEVTIACGISKGDKNEQIIKRGTELGVTHFLFFESRYSVARWTGSKADKKLKRLKEIAKAAAEQSHRQLIPSVEIVAEQDLLTSTIDHRLIAYEESAKQGEQSNFKALLQKLDQGNQLLAVFGPEGGFAEKEVADFEENGFTIAGLGPRILRAETAPTYVMAALSYHFELR